MAIKVAIIGAGPAGCTLARLLHNANNPDISATIFEAESSINYRSQGGSLDLHDDTGLAALKAAGLFDEFQKHARYDGEALKISDKKLLCYIKQGGSKQGSWGTGRPEIDRAELRRILLESLPEGTVKWNHKLFRIDQADLTMSFAAGQFARGFDLIVGADGAWSKVRPLLSDVKPFYSGIAGHTLSIPDAANTTPELYALINRGSLFSFSDHKSIMAQQMGDGSIVASTWSARPADWQQSSGYDMHDAVQFEQACRKEYADWDPRLLAFTQQATNATSFAPRDLYMLPIGHSWGHQRGLTLIGDAAHLMTPFAGEGVNLAMKDALVLSRHILAAAAAAPAQLDAEVALFEQDMFRRATRTQQQTYGMMNAMFMKQDAPRQGIEEYILCALGGDLAPAWIWLLRPVVWMWITSVRGNERSLLGAPSTTAAAHTLVLILGRIRAKNSESAIPLMANVDSVVGSYSALLARACHVETVEIESRLDVRLPVFFLIMKNQEITASLFVSWVSSRLTTCFCRVVRQVPTPVELLVFGMSMLSGATDRGTVERDRVYLIVLSLEPRGGAPDARSGWTWSPPAAGQAES
nr:monooxygenase asqm [Quercus suber]